MCECEFVPFFCACMLYIASVAAGWHWWSIIIITWADGKVPPWLDPVDRHCLVSHSARVNVYVRMPPSVFFYGSFSNIAATLTWLYWQVPYANKWPRLAGSAKGDGCIRLHQAGEWRAPKIQGWGCFISLALRPPASSNKTHRAPAQPQTLW